MKFSNFENLKDLGQEIEANTQGELATHLGNAVNDPIDDGLGMFNQAVSQMMTYGDHQVSINEGVEYAYDIKPIYDRLDKITAYLRNKLKQINEKEMEKNKDFEPDPRTSSALGFIGAEDKDDEFKALRAAMKDAQYPPSLSTDIKFKDKSKFLNVLKGLFKDEDPETLKGLISSASGFISTFDINSVRQFIAKIESEIDKRKFYSGNVSKQSREQNLNLLVGEMMKRILITYGENALQDHEKVVNDAIAKWLPEIAKNYAQKDYINSDIKEKSDKPNLGELPDISIAEVREALNKEFSTGGNDIDVLKNLYLGEKVGKLNTPAFERPAKPNPEKPKVDKNDLNVPTFMRNKA